MSGSAAYHRSVRILVARDRGRELISETGESDLLGRKQIEARLKIRDASQLVLRRERCRCLTLARFDVMPDHHFEMNDRRFCRTGGVAIYLGRLFFDMKRIAHRVPAGQD
ncbi:hypothetical protein [Caballeronia arationis]|uniref:hypothetical protein n=1 Tax=Caballeronia arationis TaxID=1777142 RepID=UPI00119821FC|nr:hypothetical protein [Caballeronia arationis]